MVTETLSEQGVSPRNTIVRCLRREMAEGVLAAGEPLPSERSLTQRFGVARNTVRAALDQLAEEGWLGARVGPGRRNRLVRGRSAPVGATIARDTVVVVGRSRSDLDPTHRHAGWADFVDYGVQEEIDQRGLHLLVFNPAKLGADFAALSEQRVYGLLIPSGLADATGWDRVRTMADAGTPVAVFGEEPEGGRIDRVISAHEQGAYELTRWLLARGCRRPQMLWCSDVRRAWARARRAGHERAMAEAGLPALAPIQTLEFMPPADAVSSRDAYEMRARYLAGYLAPALLGATPADALMAPTDGEALVLTGVLARLGKAPNRDVWVAGYDNFWEDCPERAFAPCGPAVTVDKQNPLIGAEMVRLLIERAEQGLPSDAQTRRVPQRLVETGEVASMPPESARSSR
jgi:DNA-binding LacI/PurR family transcriptional regulator